MKKVITYGTYDFLHIGHINVLKNAKSLGDYLIVGVTSDEFDKSRGKLDVWQPLAERIAAVENTGLADEIIIEEYEGQKISDIQKYDIDVFTVGSDWVGKFDYLKEYCDVVYLPRTEGVSSTQIRAESQKSIRLGILGSQRPIGKFIPECQNVSGIEISGIYSDDFTNSSLVGKQFGIAHYEDRNNLIDASDALYIIDSIDKHAPLIECCLEQGKHIICEGPMFLNVVDAERLFALASEKQRVLFDAVKTRFFPGYTHLLLMVKSGKIGQIKDVEVSISQNINTVNYAQLDKYNGSLYTLGGYCMLPIFQILGDQYNKIELFSSKHNYIDQLTEGIILYNSSIAKFKAALGLKTEGEMIITGTKGYIYVPAPWWKTDFFEIRYEDLRDTKKYFWQYEGDGFRYELMEFRNMISANRYESGDFPSTYTKKIAAVMELFDSNNYNSFD